MRKVGILTGGGDCPGLNAVIRAAVEKCISEGVEVFGFWGGWKGVLEADGRWLTLDDVEGIQVKGGTILETSRTNVMKYEDGPQRVKASMEKLGLEGLIAIGGDDTLGVAAKLQDAGLNMVGVPKTIDNDLSGTDYTFGFDTASNIAMEAIDRIHTTAQSHGRIIVVEIMGRHTGWIALQAGLAGDAHMVLIPEFPKSVDDVCNLVMERRKRGKRYSIIAVAEGVILEGMDEGKLQRDDFGNVSLPDNNVGETIAKIIHEKTGLETRHVVLGHLQRGGAPTAFDRVLGTRMGYQAGEHVVEKNYGYMVSLNATKIVSVPLKEAVSTRKKVDEDFYKCAELYFR